MENANVESFSPSGNAAFEFGSDDESFVAENVLAVAPALVSSAVVPAVAAGPRRSSRIAGQKRRPTEVPWRFVSRPSLPAPANAAIPLPARHVCRGTSSYAENQLRSLPLFC